MLPVKGTKLVKFQLFLNISPVFLGGIVTPLALAALQGYQLYHLLLACHNSTSSIITTNMEFYEVKLLR